MVCVSLVSQSCLILCDPVDYSLPGSSVHGILPGKNTGVGSVQFSHSVMSDSLRPHGLQHTRPPYPSPTPRACSNSCPLNQWCHPTISSSSSAFSSCLQSFPASESFPMSQFFTLGSQSIGTSASASVLPKNIQDWFPLGLTGLICLLFNGLSRVFSSTTIQKHLLFQRIFLSWRWKPGL